MKILSNKKYNELILKSCKGMFGAVTDDMLLRENALLNEENKQLKEEKRKVRDYINKHCVNEKVSKEVGYECYTMADTNELEHIMKLLGEYESLEYKIGE